MNKNLIIGIVLGIITVSVVFIFMYVDSNSKTQKVEYYCKISEQRLNNVGCTSNADCWTPGVVCDTLLYKCVVLTAGQVNGIERVDKLTPPENQQNCENIGGNWELKLK